MSKRPSKRIVAVVDPGHMFDPDVTLGYISVPADMDLGQQQTAWFACLLGMTEAEWRAKYPTLLDYLLDQKGVEKVDVEEYTVRYPYG